MKLRLMLALLAGIAIGSGMDFTSASTKAPGYLVVEYEIMDPEGWREYLAGSRSIRSERRFLARHAEGISLAGESPKWIGIIQYPSVDDALAHDASDEYAALKPIRDRSTNWRAYVVEGLHTEE